MREYHTHCKACGHPVRQRDEKARDFPGTYLIASWGMCSGCYRQARRTGEKVRHDEEKRSESEPRNLSDSELRVREIVEFRVPEGTDRDQVLGILGLTGFEDHMTLAVNPEEYMHSRMIARGAGAV